MKKREIMPLTDLPEVGVLEEIFGRLSPSDSANLARVHPMLGRVYRHRILSDLEHARTWDGFVSVVDKVLNHQAGVLDRLSIRLRNFTQQAEDENAVNTAVARWLVAAHRLHVSVLELHGIPRLFNITTRVNFFHFNWQALVDLHLTSISFPQFLLVPQFQLPILRLLHLQSIDMAPGNDLAIFLDTCPNLRFFVLHLCFENGSLTLHCPLLETLDIRGVPRWTICIEHLPSLTDFRIHSGDLGQSRLLRHPMSMAPIPTFERRAVINVRSISIIVMNNLPAVITFVQSFHSLRHLNLVWYAPASMDNCQYEHEHELVALETVTIGGSPLYNEPLRVMVEYILGHSPNLNRFSLVVPRGRVLEDDYLEIQQRIRELPRLSQQAQFEFAWGNNDDEDSP